MRNCARLAKEFESPFPLSAFLEDHRQEVDALGLAREVAKEVVAKAFSLIDTAIEEYVKDAIGAFVELVDAAVADLLVRFGRPVGARRGVLRRGRGG